MDLRDLKAELAAPIYAGMSDAEAATAINALSMFKNVAAKFMVFAFDTTTNAPKTGDAANITAYVSKDYGAVTVLGDTTATEMDATNAPGYYLFDAAQAETNADCLMVSGKSSTANIKVLGAPAVIYTRPTTGWLAPATAGRTLVVDAAGLADANVVKVGPTGSGTAQTAGDLAAMITAVDDYIDTEVSAIKAKTDNLPASPAATGDIPSETTIADALLNRDMSAVTVTNSRSPINALRTLRNKVDVPNGTVYAEDDTTAAWTFTTTTSAAADPITVVDPT